MDPLSDPNRVAQLLAMQQPGGMPQDPNQMMGAAAPQMQNPAAGQNSALGNAAGASLGVGGPSMLNQPPPLADYFGQP